MLVLDETEKPEPNAARVEEYVSSDQTLTAQMLRLVNSAYYGLSGQIASVAQGIVILGLHQVRNLVLSIGSISTFEASTRRQQETLRAFWIHAFATAAATQDISKSKRLGGRESELMFIGGLLHDIGRLFLFCHFTDAYDDAIDFAFAEGVSIEDAEEEFFSIRHPEIGAEIAEHWKLPEALCRIIREHEGPFDNVDDPVLLGVHVADCLAKHMYFSQVGPQEYVIDSAALSWLAMDSAELAEIQTEAEKRTDEAMVLFGALAA